MGGGREGPYERGGEIRGRTPHSQARRHAQAERCMPPDRIGLCEASGRGAGDSTAKRSLFTTHQKQESWLEQGGA